MELTPAMTIVEFKFMKFVLAPAPNTVNIYSYIEELLEHNTNTIVKVCESKYNEATFISNGITVKNFTYPDGSFPSNEVIDHWIAFVDHYFHEYPGTALAVHCQSGLGRSAVLIALAMMEGGLEKAQVVDTIRKQRRGSFNKFQVEKLIQYQSRYRLLETDSDPRDDREQVYY